MVKFVWESLVHTFWRTLHSPFAFQLLTLGFFVLFFSSFRPPYFVGGGELFGEEFFGEKLEGTSALEKLEKDVFGNPVIPSDLEKAESQNGADIYLTINN